MERSKRWQKLVAAGVVLFAQGFDIFAFVTEVAPPSIGEKMLKEPTVFCLAKI